MHIKKEVAARATNQPNRIRCDNSCQTHPKYIQPDGSMLIACNTKKPFQELGKVLCQANSNFAVIWPQNISLIVLVKIHKWNNDPAKFKLFQINVETKKQNFYFGLFNCCMSLIQRKGNQSSFGSFKALPPNVSMLCEEMFGNIYGILGDIDIQHVTHNVQTMDSMTWLPYQKKIRRTIAQHKPTKPIKAMNYCRR